MKLQEALRKVIRQFGVSVIQEKRLMPFLSDYKAFEDYPAVKDVMRAIATGDYGKELCRTAGESNAEYLRFAGSLKKSLVRDRNFKQELADYAVDSISFALGLVSSVTEPDDHGYEAVQKSSGWQGNLGIQGGGNASVSSKGRQEPSPLTQGGGAARGRSGSVRDACPDGAVPHCRIYRGNDLTAAFESGEFSECVADGTFRGIYPGDYITRKVSVYGADGVAGTYTVRFIIADLDIALSRELKTHHAVIVPETPPFETYMNTTIIKNGYYAVSYMSRTVMPAFAQGLAAAFGPSHLMSFSADGQSCKCRLMTLSMVFGEALPDGWVWDPIDRDYCLGRGQLAAFRLNPDLRGRNMRYWVSDALSSRLYTYVHFMSVHYSGGIHVGLHDTPEHPSGVRPFALLV